MPAGGEIVVMSEAFHSGSGRYLLQLANALSDIEPVTVVSPPHESERGFGPKVVRRHLPDIQGLKPALLKAFAMQRQTLCRIWLALTLRRRAKVYLVLFPGKVVFALQLLAALKLCGRRVVLNVHDVRPHARHLRIVPQAVERLLFTLCYRLPHAIVVQTDAAARELAELHGVPSARIFVVPHGDFSLSPAILPPPDEDGVFLVFGALRANKCVMESIRAVQSLRREDGSTRLILAGAASKEESAYWQACKRQIAEAPEGIELREGYVADGDLPALFRASSALLLPYRDFSSQSGVAVMAIAAGRPIVATASGGIADLFAAGDIGARIAEPVTADTIMDALRTFRQRPAAERHAGVVEAAKALSQAASWPQVAAGFRQALSEAA
ncbi:MAG: glycosyltransferase family 4 protein [Alphaproteobacteria bacterium]